MEFPNLKDTRYPNLDNVNVYSYQNDFDYTRWVPNTKLKLVNVRWNGDYADVVKFESDTERDAFFDELSTDPECTVTLTTNLRMDRDTIKVPIPFDKAAQYNYLVVDIPIATGSNNPIAYENADGFRRWHFFIQDWQNTAPSTTVLTLALDYWTQYINSVGINYMLLERGHAPVAVTDTETYLANPIDNADYLLAKDIDYGNDTVTRGGKFIPFGNGEKYICFASTCTVSQLTELGTVLNSQGGFTNPTFSDASNYPDSSNRWGYQYVVNNYSWAVDKSYANTKTPAGNPVTSDGRIPNNATVYAVPSSDANGFLRDLLKTSPTFLKTVLGCFMVDKALVSVASTHLIGGHTVYVLSGGKNDFGSFELKKDMFGYPEKYERFAKLYTYPYAELEVTDNEGKTANVRIESTGSIKAQAITSVAFPYLNMRLFLTGISGQGSNTYKWTDLAGTHDEEISNSDWYKFCYDFQVPMYALYMDGNTAWNIHNFNRTVSYGRSSALVNYHNSARQANNVYANTVAESGTAETNAHNTSDTNTSNLKRTANTNETNTDNQAATLRANNTNNCNCATDITANNNATMIANMQRGHTYQTGVLMQDIIRANYETSITNNVIHTTTETENEVTTSTTNNTVKGNIFSSAVTGASSGAMSGVSEGLAGIVAGAGVGLLTSATAAIITGEADKDNATIITQANSAVASATMSKNNGFTSNTNSYNTTKLSAQQDNNIDQTNNTANNATRNTARQNACATANTNNTANTMETNADNTRATIHTNADAQNSTAKGNATRTKNTTQNNGLYTRNAAITAAQDILTNTQNGTKALVQDSYNMDVVQLCANSGDYTSEYMHTRGIQIKVRTQSTSAIRQTGDVFARYGYAVNQIWNVEESGLCLMKHFTYWKSTDCWVYDKCETNDTAQNTISALFNRGVTVWSNPKEVGRVNPYDN